MASKALPKIVDLVESDDPDKITLSNIIARLTDTVKDLKAIEIDQNINACERVVKELTTAQKDLFYLRNRVAMVKQNIVISRKNNKIIINK